MQVPVVENVLKLNEAIAAINRETLQTAGVFAIDLMGGPGCGKTTLIEASLRDLGHRIRMGVMVGDLTTTRDADRLIRWSEHVVQINTGKACHLDAMQVRQAMSRIDLSAIDLLIIENVGNLICPVGYDLGQNVKVGMFSVSEGDDKAIKHPSLVREAELLLLNKTDLLAHVEFDLERFRGDLERLDPEGRLVEISVHHPEGTGWGDWLDWLKGTGTIF